jgi:signal transduction histidine kinase
VTVDWTSVNRTGEGQALACPPDIAHWLHDEVVQRLASVAAALGADGRLATPDRRRCGTELEAALGALRLLLNDRLEPPPRRRYRSVVEAVRAHCAAPDGHTVRLRILGDAELEPAAGQFVADFVAEALRNAAKHARAELIAVTVASDREQASVVVLNDGVTPVRERAGAGVGLRLLAARALDHGGSVATGARHPDGWTTTLTVARRRRAEAPLQERRCAV